YSRADNSDNALNGILKKLYATPSFGDIDADGDLDLILGDLDGSIQLYYNHGNATAPDFDSSPSTESIFASIGVANYAQPILGDFNGDGLLDLVVASPGRISTFINIGNSTSPRFTASNPDYAFTHWFDHIANTSSYLYKLSASDYDGDGDLDIIVGVTAEQSICSLFYYENTGDKYTPLFVDQTKNMFGYSAVRVPGFGGCGAFGADIDGDGDRDLVVLSDRLLHYYENIGSGLYPQWEYRDAEASNPFSFFVFASPAMVDTDADGDLDMAVCVSLEGIIFVENIGSSILPEWNQLSVFNENNPFLSVNSLKLDGTLTFNRCDLSFADIDGDGDFDMLLAELDGRLTFFVNTGTNVDPSYSSVLRKSAADPFRHYDIVSALSAVVISVSFGDLDLDGDIDMVLSEGSDHLLFLENIGNMTHAKYWVRNSSSPDFLLAGVDAIGPVRLVDLDDDSDLDLVIMDGATMAFYESKNIGSLTNPIFTLTFLGLSSLGDPTAVAVHDVDDDGDMDIILSLSSSIVVYENSGDPSTPFSHSNQATLDGIDGVSPSILLSDVDLDGDMDVILGGNDGMVRLYANG
ncbi:unnamed protein product, partial [Ectocarpus fasciculatus]